MMSLLSFLLPNDALPPLEDIACIARHEENLQAYHSRRLSNFAQWDAFDPSLRQEVLDIVRRPFCAFGYDRVLLNARGEEPDAVAAMDGCVRSPSPAPRLASTRARADPPLPRRQVLRRWARERRLRRDQGLVGGRRAQADPVAVSARARSSSSSSHPHAVFSLYLDYRIRSSLSWPLFEREKRKLRSSRSASRPAQVARELSNLP